MARSGETGDRLVERSESFASQGVGPLGGCGRGEQVLDEGGPLVVRTPLELGSMACVSERLFQNDNLSAKVVPLDSNRITAASGVAGRLWAQAGKLLLKLRDGVLEPRETGARTPAPAEPSVLRKERVDSFPARYPHV